MDQLRELSEIQSISSAEEEESFSKTAALLMDVNLQVRVLFGRTQIRLKDLLKLGSGSIVELDRRPDDAVELLVNNRVIARAQVVVVDGCYGVRITEILRRGDGSENPTAADLMSLFQNVG